jgi:hypothetical protein
MRIPIGELLMQQGVLTAEQCQAVLDRQAASHRPFGEIAEELFHVDGKAVERAWASQYAKITRWVDPLTETVDPMVQDLVTRRQAWQFRLLPMGYDGSELMVCTTQDGLIRAMNFAVRQLPVTCYFVLTAPETLAAALMRIYPMDGMTPELITGEAPTWVRKAG